MTLNIECHYAKCDSYRVSFSLGVANKPNMLGIILFSVIMLIVILLSVIMLNATEKVYEIYNVTEVTLQQKSFVLMNKIVFF